MTPRRGVLREASAVDAELAGGRRVAPHGAHLGGLYELPVAGVQPPAHPGSWSRARGPPGAAAGQGVNLSPRIYLQATTVGVGQTTSALAEKFRLLLEYAITESFTGSAPWGTPSNRWGVDLFWSP